MTLTIPTVATALATALLCACAYGAETAELGWQSTTSSSFSRIEKAWASYQLKATNDQYRAGDVVVPAVAPANTADIFSVYKLRPPSGGAFTYQVQAASGASGRICVYATLRQPAELNGFLQGVRQAGASFAQPDCSPATLNSSISYPVAVSAFKVVNAKRASELIAKDAGERAAQWAVAPTITFVLPTGRLLDFVTPVGGTSVPKGTSLLNTSALPWTLTPPLVEGPFTATYTGCDLVIPTISATVSPCNVFVAFQPTTQGSLSGRLSMTTSTGKTLVLRLNGISTSP